MSLGDGAVLSDELLYEWMKRAERKKRKRRSGRRFLLGDMFKV